MSHQYRVHFGLTYNCTTIGVQSELSIFLIVLKITDSCIAYSFPGGFYTDTFGYVAESCMKCPNGSFVAYDKAPGTKPQDCKACPEGRQSSNN